jgi:hypothetical protein
MSKLSVVRNVIWATTNSAHHNHLHVDVYPKMTGTPPGKWQITQGVKDLLAALEERFGPYAYFTEKKANTKWTHMGWYNHRKVAGSTTWSQHAWGNALDIGPYYGVEEQQVFYDFLMGLEKEDELPQFNDKEVHELKAFVKEVLDEGSSMKFVEYIIKDIRKDIITRDELTAAISAALANASGESLTGKRLVLRVEDVS